MDFVTITDHNTIDGCLEIAHLPGTFISEEITTYFVDNGCKIHILALNINESQHEEISKVRHNIFELATYLKREEIIHIVAHPLFSINDRLTIDHFEKLLLLFDAFELNGTRDAYQNAILSDILTHLTPEYMEMLSVKHGMESSSKEPWRKSLTGGSDDHSGFHIARTYTLVEESGGINAFLDAIGRHKSSASGDLFHPQILAHALYSIAYQFYNKKFKFERFQKKDPFVAFASQILGRYDNSDPKPFKARKKTLNNNKTRNLPGVIREELLSDFCLQTLRDVLDRFPQFNRMEMGRSLRSDEKSQYWYQFANQASEEILARLFNTAIKKIYSGNIFEIFQMLGTGGALHTVLAPYFIAYKIFTKDRLFVKKIHRQATQRETVSEPLRVGHFTDTLHEINGVSITLKKQLEIAMHTGKEMALITCGPGKSRPGFKLFEPIGSFKVPEYPELTIHYPPLLKMLDYCYENELNRIHIATPGPVGLAALAIARILQLPVYGTYHTAFPQYVKELTGDTGLEKLTWKYMVWFYNQMDLVLVPSRTTGEELQEQGVQKKKIRFYPRGIDTTFFHPAKRNGFYKSRYDLSDSDIKLLYVGRVAKEKNLDQLSRIMRMIADLKKGVHLVIVGDGPYLPELKRELKGLPVIFTGFMDGNDLSEAYASSDIFVFPSTTDTFGNVVLEAQASGLPVIVTDQGGPCENLIPGVTGFVVPANDILGFSEKIIRLIQNPAQRFKMKAKAREYMEKRSFESAFAMQWDMYLQPLSGRVSGIDPAGLYH